MDDQQILDTIRNLGNTLDDLERVRIMNGNRIGALEREYGSAIPHLEGVQEPLVAVEHLAHLGLVRAWRKHPLAPWAKTVTGLGEKSIARLIAVVGDPGERPNPAKLWAYCGHGDPERSHKRKGMTQAELFKAGNPHAKKRVYLIAEAMVKNRDSAYRDVYDATRKRYAESTHERPCPRCGPAGHPAPAGSPLSDGHKHARAMRAVGKAFLLDLWKQARAGHPVSDAQNGGARAGQVSSDAHNLHARAGQDPHDAHGRSARAGDIPAGDTQ